MFISLYFYFYVDIELLMNIYFIIEISLININYKNVYFK